jgi:hypothetical protein
MTRDEIRAEFEAWVKSKTGTLFSPGAPEASEFYFAIYLAAAEAREKRIAELERERDRAVEVADAATKGVYSKYMLEAAAAIGRDLSQGLEINGLKARLAQVTEALRDWVTAAEQSGYTHHPDPDGDLLMASRAALAEEQEQKP